MAMLATVANSLGSPRGSSPTSERGLHSTDFQEMFRTGSLELDVNLNREDLVRQVTSRVARDDSFIQLPFTVLQLIIFLFLVVLHLQVVHRHELESALQDWVRGSSRNLTGPFFADHVADDNSFWDWLEASALPAVLGGRVDVDSPSGLPLVELASVSVLVGDVQLWQRRADGSETSAWLLHTEQAHTGLAARPGAFLDAAMNATRRLRASGWLGDDAEEVQLRFCTYAERARTFGLTEVAVPLKESGVVHPTVASTAAMLDAYPQVYAYALDAIYLLLLLHKFTQEAFQVCQALQVGWDGFTAYWSIWNFIDWTDITLGAVGCGFWISCCLAMQAESLHSLVQEDSGLLNVDVMALSMGQVEEVHNAIRNIRRVYIELHLVFAANVIAIMATFFKAFEANPRLKVVTSTLTRSFNDIVHFMVVFVTVFFCFAVIGHVLFGSDLPQFYTTGTALNTGFVVLMGEFNWYVEVQHYPSPNLPSGTPFILVNIWFVLYMFFVLLVLLNMLLAIILSHYTNVTESHHGSMTIWGQISEYIRWRVATRGFFKLSQMFYLLEDDDNPAHPGEEVTAESLLQAFPAMQRRQADFMIAWLSTEKIRAEMDEADGAAAISASNEDLVHTIHRRVKDLSAGLERTSNRIGRLESAPLLSNPVTVNV